MKKLLLVGIPILAVLVALGVAYHFVVDTDTAARWYVQVDNARVQPPGEDSDEYEYSSMPTTKTAVGTTWNSKRHASCAMMPIWN